MSHICITGQQRQANELECCTEDLTDPSLQQYNGEQTACRCAADHINEVSSAIPAELSLAPPGGRNVVVDRAAQATPVIISVAERIASISGT